MYKVLKVNMLDIYSIIEGKISKSEQGNVWVYSNISDEEKNELIEKYNIDEHTLNCALDSDELSRLEFETDHAALILKCPKHYSAKDFFRFKAVSIGLFLFEDKLIIISAPGVELFIGKHFDRIQNIKELTIKILYQFVIQFEEHLKVINKLSDESEQRLSSSVENKFLMNLFSLQKSLVYYTTAIESNGDLLKRIKNETEKIGLYENEIKLLDDLLIENTQCERLANIYSNILNGLMDARVSIVSNNLNILMKTLNFITICIMVPNFIVSVFSMNVKIPFSWHPQAFWLVLGLSVISVFIFSLIWRRKRW